jgi:hypothetical protein
MQKLLQVQLQFVRRELEGEEEEGRGGSGKEEKKRAQQGQT